MVSCVRHLFRCNIDIIFFKELEYSENSENYCSKPGVSVSETLVRNGFKLHILEGIIGGHNPRPIILTYGFLQNYDTF
jgi:hypothetical protein